MDSGSSSSAAKSQFPDDVPGVVEENPNGQKFETPCFKEFCFADLETATSNFEPEALLGEGANGKVYKGWIDKKTLAPTESGTGMAVAVRLWNPENISAFEQWQSEVNILGRCYHPNLIELLGYCWEDEMLVLVYECMEKGSLENHLFQSAKRKGDCIQQLSWDIRLKIAIGAARGLVFLHTLERQIIYRDFKPSAILLDANYNPKLSDFGLAKLGPSGDKTHVTTRMLGTQGYAAPEYLGTGHLSTKSDVYSFGVVLLELLTGLRLADLDYFKPGLRLADLDYFKPTLLLKCKLKLLMKGQYSSEAAEHAAQLTLKCLEVNNHKDRPSMKEVLEVLLQVEEMTSMKEVPELLEQIEAVTSVKEASKVLEHVEALEEKPNNSKCSSPRSTTPYHSQPRIRHRFLTSLKATCQCVSSKLNCMKK